MVKRAFLEDQIRSSMQLTSANSINVARWIPQLLYFVSAIRQQPNQPPPVFSVPSGNFGNICAGMLAHQMGMPCSGFIAATNVNDTVPRYMAGEAYEPRPAVATISNAMDVAEPSNFIRIRQLFENRFEDLNSVLSAYSYTDEQTRKAIVELHQKYGYTADPHGAIGYLGLTDYLKDHPEAPGIFLETAHPIKFRKEVEGCIEKELEIPAQIQRVLNKEKSSTAIASFEELQDFLLSMKTE
jgi:threonine synthase